MSEIKNRWTGLAGCLAALCLFAVPGEAKIGVGTQFVDAVMEGLEPGETYNIRELRGIPYSVKNVGDAEQEIVIEVGIPETKHMKEDYEPIPDPNWIRLTPDRHVVPAGGAAYSDIIISIPNDPSLAGRHFQAEIWAHTAGSGFFGTGVKSRIRFSIGPGPASLAAEKRRKAMVSVNFDIWPSALYVERAEAGKAYDVKKQEKKSLKVTNRSDEPLDLVIKAVPWDKRQPPTVGYEPAASADWVTVKPGRVKIKPNSVVDVSLTLKVPEEYRGRKVVFLIETALPIGTVLSSAHRVNVTVKE